MTNEYAPWVCGGFLAIFTAILAWLVVKRRPSEDARVARRWRVMVTWPLGLYLLGNGVLHENVGLCTGVGWDYVGVILFWVTMMLPQRH